MRARADTQTADVGGRCEKVSCGCDLCLFRAADCCDVGFVRQRQRSLTHTHKRTQASVAAHLLKHLRVLGGQRSGAEVFLHEAPWEVVQCGTKEALNLLHVELMSIYSNTNELL